MESMISGKREMRFFGDATEMVITLDGMPIPMTSYEVTRQHLTDEQLDAQIAEVRRIATNGGITRRDASRFVVVDSNGSEQTVEICWCEGVSTEVLDIVEAVLREERVAAVDCTCGVSACTHSMAVTYYLGEWDE